ncbi:MAG: SCO family protein [Propionibacteriaceae bacterium]
MSSYPHRRAPRPVRRIGPGAHRPLRRLRPLVLGVVLLGLVAGFGACSGSEEPAELGARSNQDGYRGTYLDDLYQLPDTTLTDTWGDAYNLKTSPSKPVTLVFFGYTHCPDICRAVLSDVAVALRRSPDPVRDKVLMIFITTDPTRDTPPVNAAYLAKFNPDFIGLTGDLKVIQKVAGGMGVEVGGRTKLASGGYTVSHSTPVIGFDKDGGAQVLWTPSTPISDLTADLGLLVSRQS